MDSEKILQRLRQMGAHCDVDGIGTVRHIRFAGSTYTDECVDELAAISGVDSIDIRDTLITEQGAARLRQLLPKTIVHRE